MYNKFWPDNPSKIPAANLKVTKQTGKYHIVAGAFRVEENCDTKVTELKALGFSARKIGANRFGLHEVVYASYEDRLEALKALRTIKKEHNKEKRRKKTKTKGQRVKEKETTI